MIVSELKLHILNFSTTASSMWCVMWLRTIIKHLTSAKPSVSISPTTVSVMKGQQASILCNAASSSQITEYKWYLVGLGLIDTSINNLYNKSGGSLIISSVDNSGTAGNYTCTARNGAGVSDHSNAVSVTAYCKYSGYQFIVYIPGTSSL